MLRLHSNSGCLSLPSKATLSRWLRLEPDSPLEAMTQKSPPQKAKDRDHCGVLRPAWVGERDPRDPLSPSPLFLPPSQRDSPLEPAPSPRSLHTRYLAPAGALEVMSTNRCCGEMFRLLNCSKRVSVFLDLGCSGAHTKLYRHAPGLWRERGCALLQPDSWAPLEPRGRGRAGVERARTQSALPRGHACGRDRSGVGGGGRENTQRPLPVAGGAGAGGHGVQGGGAQRHVRSRGVLRARAPEPPRIPKPQLAGGGGGGAGKAARGRRRAGRGSSALGTILGSFEAAHEIPAARPRPPPPLANRGAPGRASGPEARRGAGRMLHPAARALPAGENLPGWAPAASSLLPPSLPAPEARPRRGQRQVGSSRLRASAAA